MGCRLYYLTERSTVPLSPETCDIYLESLPPVKTKINVPTFTSQYCLLNTNLPRDAVTYTCSKLNTDVIFPLASRSVAPCGYGILLVYRINHNLP